MNRAEESFEDVKSTEINLTSLFRAVANIIMALRRLLAVNSLNARLCSTQAVASVQATVPKVEDSVSVRDKLYSKLEIELRGVDPAVLKSYSWFATTAAEHLGIEIGQWCVVSTSLPSILYYNNSGSLSAGQSEKRTTTA